MNSTGFQVGDEIEIELPDSSTHYLTVVGLVSDQQSAKPTSSGIVNAFITTGHAAVLLGWALISTAS